MPESVAIVRRFVGYSPPVDVESSIRMLLRYVPEEQLAGLRSIVLTNSTSSRRLRRGKTWSRGRKVPMSQCRGFYCGDHIELLVDNLLRVSPPWTIRWQVTRTILVGMVLYHEIGHHIHATQRPERKEKEDVADEWGKRLLRQFLERRYWYTRPAWPILRFWVRTFVRNPDRGWLVAAVAWTFLIALDLGCLFLQYVRHGGGVLLFLLMLPVSVIGTTIAWAMWLRLHRKRAA